MFQDEPQWYAFYVRSRSEKKVVKRLINIGVDAYVPVIQKEHRWSDRRKMVDEPLIPGYIFCRIKIENRVEILQTPGVTRILKLAGEWAPIPDDQIETLKIFVQNSETLKPEAAITLGEKVRMARGAFQGAVGVVKQESGKSRLVLSFEKLGLAYSVVVKKTDVQRLQI